MFCKKGATLHRNLEKLMTSYVQASLIGAGSGLVSLIVEHPFDTVKTRCQAHPDQRLDNVVREIHQRYGVRGFYSGYIPNGVRLALKQSYRYPMMLGLSPFFKRTISEPLQKQYPTIPKIATAFTIANFEVGIICPLERLKVYLMTADHRGKGISEFARTHRSHLFPELTRGMQALWVRQVVTWVSFLAANEKFTLWEQERLGTKDLLPFASLMKVSFYVGLVNTLANMPFDVAKTHLQQAKFIENKGLIKTIKKIYQSYGVQGLYRGWQIRMTQYMIQSAFTVPMLARLDISRSEITNREA